MDLSSPTDIVNGEATVIVDGATFARSANPGIEKGFTLVGIHLDVGWTLISEPDTLAAAVSASVFLADVDQPVAISDLTVFPNEDILWSRCAIVGPQAVEPTNDAHIGVLNWHERIKTMRKLTSETEVRIVWSFNVNLVGVIARVSSLVLLG